MVNQQQLFNLKRSSLGDSGNLDPDPTNLSFQNTNLPFYQPKKIKTGGDTPPPYPYGTRSKTQTQAIFPASDPHGDNGEATGWRSLASMVTPWVKCKLKMVSYFNSILLHANII